MPFTPPKPQSLKPVQPIKPPTVSAVHPPAVVGVKPIVSNKIVSKPVTGPVMSTTGMAQSGPTIQELIKRISDWAKAAKTQLQGYNLNPNKWGQSGQGTFQGLPVPKAGPSMWEMFRQNVPDWLKPWQPKKIEPHEHCYHPLFRSSLPVLDEVCCWCGHRRYRHGPYLPTGIPYKVSWNTGNPGWGRAEASVESEPE